MFDIFLNFFFFVLGFLNGECVAIGKKEGWVGHN